VFSSFYLLFRYDSSRSKEIAFKELYALPAYRYLALTAPSVYLAVNKCSLTMTAHNAITQAFSMGDYDPLTPISVILILFTHALYLQIRHPPLFIFIGFFMEIIPHFAVKINTAFCSLV